MWYDLSDAVVPISQSWYYIIFVIKIVNLVETVIYDKFAMHRLLLIWIYFDIDV